MNNNPAQVMPESEQKVVLMTLLSTEDRATTDRVVFSETPGHLVDGHPWSATLLRRIGEDAVVRDYLATFACTEEGARRVLMLTLGLAKMVNLDHPGCDRTLARLPNKATCENG